MNPPPEAEATRLPLIFCLVLAACGGSCAPVEGVEEPGGTGVEATSEPEAPAVSKMGALLAEIRDRDLQENVFFGRRLVSELERKLADEGPGMDPRERIGTRSLLGLNYLNYGEIDHGIEALTAVHDGLPGLGAPESIRAKAAFDLGMAYFRLAETENCCAINASESCILPLEGAAIHTERRGSEMAMTYFAEALSLSGSNKKVELEATWFLNLAAMTLGEFPDAVPAEARIPGLFDLEGDGTFVDVAEAAGVTNLRMAKGVAWGDFDGDRFPDLVVSNYEEGNRLYMNQRDGTFVDVAPERGTAMPRMSFPVWTWDYNNDGWLDFFISSYNGNVASYVYYAQGKRLNRLEPSGHYRGDGNGGFENRAIVEGLLAPMATMGCSMGDLDNDGWLDFYLGTGEPNIAVVIPNQLFMNQCGAGFAERTMASGMGHLQKGHAVAFADLDEDGDLDVFEQMGGARRVDAFRDALYENAGAAGTHWIKVKLVGVESNRSGVGARICVRFRGDDGKRRSVFRWVGGGASFGGNPLRQHIGIGRAAEVDLLEVYWPTSGVTDTFLGVGADRTVVVTEGEKVLGKVEARAWALGR